jgi:hypothetical protein
VTNWAEYDAALVRRGSLIVWVTEEAVAAWHAAATGKRGGQPVYSNPAIETGLALCLVLRLGLRQIEGHSDRSHTFTTSTSEFRITLHSVAVGMA